MLVTGAIKFIYNDFTLIIFVRFKMKKKFGS